MRSSGPKDVRAGQQKRGLAAQSRPHKKRRSEGEIEETPSDQNLLKNKLERVRQSVP